LRTGHFSGIQTPTLFVHGTRDAFGSIAEMEAALKLVPARTELLTVSGAGHELVANRKHDELPMRVARAFWSFVHNGVESGHPHLSG
jgi:hypothetical protein